MEEVRSAGTVVAAILETMGLVTQEQILHDFGKFFNSGGALVYLIVCIGAIVSLVIFGSVRMGTYLLVGPGLFAFLLMNTMEIKPVAWKLGASEPTSVDPNFIGPLQVHKPREEIKVSWFFGWYTKLIDQFVNSSVDLILENENDQKLLFIMRDEVLNILRRTAPTDNDLTAVLIDDLYGSCSKYMATMNAFAKEKYTDFSQYTLKMQASNGDSVAATNLARIQEELAKLRAQALIAGEETISLSPALKRLIGEYSDQYFATLGMSAETRGNRQLFVERDLPNLSASCQKTWNATLDLILIHSQSTLQKMMKDLNINLEMTPANERRICLEISDKIYRRYFVAHPENDPLTNPEVREDCDLVQTVALFMLRNVAANASGLAQNVQRNRDRMRLHKGQKDLMWASSSGNPADSNNLLIKKEQYGELKTRWVDGDKDHPARYEGYDPQSKSWRTFEKANFYGQQDAAYEGQQLSRLAQMTQQVFSYGMHVPYWQGVMLYLLAMAFPFSTILVLMPNRVGTFFMMPLFWLWVKSWDIGFAMVMVFDRVMWNLLPSSDAPYNPFTIIRTGTVATQGEPAELIRAALSIDPLYHVNMRLQMLSIALTVVPVVTGAVILKGKRMVLASFVDAPKDKAEHAGSLSRQQDVQGRMEALQYDMYRYAEGAGAVQTISPDGALFGKGEERAMELAWQSAAANLGVAAAGGVNKAFTEALRNGDGEGMVSALRGQVKNTNPAAAAVTGSQALFNAAASGVETYAQYMEQSKRAEFQQAYAKEETFGRFGTYTRQVDAAAQGITDGGGHLLYAANTYVGVDAAYKDLLSADYDIQKNILKKQIEAEAQLLGAGFTLAQSISGKKGGKDAQPGWIAQKWQSLTAQVLSVPLPYALGYYFNKFGAPGEEAFGQEEADKIFAIQVRNQGPKHNYAPGPNSPSWDDAFFVANGERKNDNAIRITPEDLQYRRNGAQGIINKAIQGEEPSLLDLAIGVFVDQPEDAETYAARRAAENNRATSNKKP